MFISEEVLAIARQRIQPLLDRYREDDPDACFHWRKAANGYGVVEIQNEFWRVHRLSYALFVGPLSSEDIVCHRCDRPTCFNPLHLFKGTQADNIADMVAKGRTATGVRNGSAKHSRAVILKVKLWLKSGLSSREVAAKTGVSERYIRRIAKGEFRAVD